MGFRNRNGFDPIARLVLMAGIVILIINLFFRTSILVYINWILLAYVLFRCLSTNIEKRQKEVEKFFGIFDRFRMNSDRRTPYNFYKCKGCGKTLRVPKGKGRIEIRCPICGQKIIKRT